MSRIAVYQSEFSWFILAQVVTLIAPLAFMRLYANSLEPKIFGELSLWLAVSMGASLITYSPNCAAAVKYISANSTSDVHIRKHIEAIYQINYRDVWASVAIFLTIGFFLAFLYRDPKNLISAIAACAYFAAQSSFTLRYSIANALRLRKLAFVISSIELIPRYILTALFFAFVSPTLLAAFAAIVFWSPFSLQLFRILTRKNSIFNSLIYQAISAGVSPSSQAAVYSLSIRQYSRPLKYAGIAGFVQSLSDSFVLLYYHGPTAVAAFGILLKSIYTPLSYGIAQLISFIEPVIFRKYASSISTDSESIKGASQVLIFATTLLALFILMCTLRVFGPPFISLVSGRFNASNLYLASYYMGTSALLYCVAQFQVLMITAKSGPRACLASRLTYSIVLIASNFLLGRYLSVYGIAFSYFWASIVFYAYVQVIYFRNFRAFSP